MPSFEKINYLLRPSKQVERKLIIEALQKLSKAGYFIQDYSYLGLGSVYYADFILFHKYLMIDKMICVEKANIPKRMEFNRPYEFIELKMGSISNVIPTLNRETKYFVWLDYDFILDQEKLDDIRSCLRILSPGSIFLITITADPYHLNSFLDPNEAKQMKYQEKQEATRNILNELIGKYIGKNITLNDLSKNSLPTTFAKALKNYMDFCLSSRNGIKFFQIFNFVYADHLQMLSFGGIIDNTDSKPNIDASDIYKLSFIRSDENPVRISVPPLTIREKIWLEKHIVNNPRPPAELGFELEKDFIDTFVQFYRHYPVYYETLI